MIQEFKIQRFYEPILMVVCPDSGGSGALDWPAEEGIWPGFD
jgi:hypothetical protein